MATEIAPVTVEGQAPAPAPAAPVYAYQPLPGFAEVTDPTGEVSNVRAEDVQAALAEGAHTTTQAEEFARRNGVAGQVAAGLAGVARGATFGISDPLTVGAGELLDGPKGGEEMREYLRLLKEGHDNASLVGELGGSLLPLAMGSTAGAEGAAVTGESILARASARAIQAAPRAFLEGAAIGEGQQLSEDTLGNHEIVASKYLNAGLEGGLVGLLLGGALHAGGGIVADKLGARGARAAAESAATRELPAIDADAGLKGAFETGNPFVIDPQKQNLGLRFNVEQKGGVPSGEAPFKFANGLVGLDEAGAEAGIAKRGPGGRFQGPVESSDGALRFGKPQPARVGLGDVEGVLGPVESAEGMIRIPEATAAAPTGLSSKLATLAEEQAAKGAMPSASLSGSEIQKLGTTSEAQSRRVREIGRTLLDEGISTAGASKATQADRLVKRIAEVGEDLGNQRRALEKSAIRPSADAVRQRIIDEVIVPLKSRSFTSDIQNAIFPITEEIDKKLGTRASFSSFDELWRLTKDLDEKLKWKNGVPPPTPAVEELRSMRRIMKEEFENAAEKAAVDLGEDVATKYRTSKAIFGDLKEAEKWATKGAAREAQNHAISLTDVIAGAGSLAGNIVTGNVLGVVGNVASVAGNKIRRQLGNQIAATMFDKLSRLEILNNAQQKFDAKLGGSVKAYFTGERPTSAASRARAKISPEQRRLLREAVSNPAVLTERVTSQLNAGGMGEVAPNVTRAAIGIAMRAGAYLQQRLPPEPRPTGLAFGREKPRAIGLRAQAELDNAVRALDADATLDDLARGRLDRQAWEAVRIINPPLYADMIGKIKSYTVENRPVLDRQKLVAMSIITGTPLTPYMEPKTIRGLQKAYAAPGPAGPTPAPSQPGVTDPKPFGGGGTASGGKSRSAAAYASGSDKLEADIV